MLGHASLSYDFTSTSDNTFYLWGVGAFTKFKLYTNTACTTPYVSDDTIYTQGVSIIKSNSSTTYNFYAAPYDQGTQTYDKEAYASATLTTTAYTKPSISSVSWGNGITSYTFTSTASVSVTFTVNGSYSKVKIYTDSGYSNVYTAGNTGDATGIYYSPATVQVLLSNTTTTIYYYVALLDQSTGTYIPGSSISLTTTAYTPPLLVIDRVTNNGGGYYTLYYTLYATNAYYLFFSLSANDGTDDRHTIGEISNSQNAIQTGSGNFSYSLPLNVTNYVISYNACDQSLVNIDNAGGQYTVQ